MKGNFIKINLASPKKILQWTERALKNGNLIGEVRTNMRLGKNYCKSKKHTQ